jgi:regulator-associated protein of mTOR
VGIFPYVLKLLQSPAIELRQVLVFIWAKILALDKSCQLDLVKDNGHNYFINVLASNTTVPSDQRTMSAFILSVISNNCRPGQSACLTGNLLSICVAQLNDPDPLLRRWVILCMAKLWEAFEEAKNSAVKEGIHEKLCPLLTDPVAEVSLKSILIIIDTFCKGSSSRRLCFRNFYWRSRRK